jgi:hypothetical protein
MSLARVESTGMQTLRGTVKYLPLEGGLWILEMDDGRKYQLLLEDQSKLADGRRLTVQGRPAKNQMSIGMSYPLFEVRTFTAS